MTPLQAWIRRRFPWVGRRQAQREAADWECVECRRLYGRAIGKHVG